MTRKLGAAGNAGIAALVNDLVDVELTRVRKRVDIWTLDMRVSSASAGTFTPATCVPPARPAPVSLFLAV